MLPRATALLAIACVAPPAARAAGSPVTPSAAESGPVEIFFYAAASLREVLQDLAPACERAARVRLVFNFGASSDLARQIEAGNKADVFFSADEAWMDRVERAGLLDATSRRSLLSNRLVVIGAVDSPVTIGSPSDLAARGVRRISLANPEAVPAGKYAKGWLEMAGVWEAVKDRVLPALDVRAALAAVESGGADLGVVYRTDASTSRSVRVLYEVPEGGGPPISYPVAALRERPHLDAARRVVVWLAGPEAAATFERSGFKVQAHAP